MANEKILLESGTNEFELLSFILNGCTYGVNVSKVQEIIKVQEVTPLPAADPRMPAVFMPRDELISILDLRYYLHEEKSTVENSSNMVICHFNNRSLAFNVDGVIGIRRISWSDIINPDDVVNSDNSVVTGIVKLEDGIVSILDLEKIITDINVNNGLTMKNVDELSEKVIETNRDIYVLLAEDSKMLNRLITEGLQKAGFKVKNTSNGKEALKFVSDNADEVDIIISDIEMPEMDGMAFLKSVKTNEKLKEIPFVVFSSLVNKQMEDKCFGLGADKCLSKPELDLAIEAINELVNKKKGN